MKAIKWTPSNLLPIPSDIIPTTMTYRYKTTDQPNQLKRKARCAIRGDLMKPFLQYDPSKTATFMADKVIIRTVLAFAAAKRLHLEHFDIKGAYLNERYQHDKPVFIWQPKRFDGSFKHAKPAGELIGNIYGTPPAAHIYSTKLHDHLRTEGYTQLLSDPSLFYRNMNNEFIIVAISMDDFLTAASLPSLNDEFCQTLHSKYTVKRLGKPKRYLNWSFQYNNSGIHVSQPDLIMKLSALLNMTNANPQHTPYLDGLKLKDGEPLPPQTISHFREAVGELRYLADCCRFDISFITSALARGLQAPTTDHWTALKRVVRYLLCTINHGILFSYEQNSTPLLQAFSDANYANDPSNRKSISGFVLYLNGAPISWHSKQQPVVALSTSEAEYISAASTAREIRWIQNLLTELHQLHETPTALHVDNQSSVQIANNQSPTKRRKYIDIRFQYLQDFVPTGIHRVRHIPSTNMVADIFTKPVKPTSFHKFTSELQLQPLPTKRVSFAPTVRVRGPDKTHITVKCRHTK